MKIIQPPILISASIISLAVLLVSATPIPSFDVTSELDSNALVRTNSPRYSQLGEAPYTKLFPRADETAVRAAVVRLHKSIGAIDRLANPLQKDRVASEVDVVKEVKELTLCIEGADAKFMDKRVFDTIGTIKFFVLKHPSVQGKASIDAIEVCEDAAVAKDLPQAPVWYQTPTRVKALLIDLKGDFQSTNGPGRETQLAKLNYMVLYILHLTQKEQRTIRTESQEGYSSIKDQISNWQEGPDKVKAGQELARWERLHSLLDLQHTNGQKGPNEIHTST
ncbi:hypothetical protein H0H93_016599 [Arthromyces matolae]|nr:hypothetical protein H0H93_016599 [Arthromyces matolae]